MSCRDRTGGGGGSEYDPSKPVKLNSFYPSEGGIATRVIIDGSNFGSNPDNVRVWYNNKRAPVIGVSGEKLYVVTPRQPGDTCTVSIVVGNDSVVSEQPFYYRTSVYVKTIAGKKGTKEFKGGTLAGAEFSQPFDLTIDAEGNLFGTQRSPGLCWMLNEEKDIVMQLPNSSGYTSCIPALDITGRIVIFPDDCCDNYYLYDSDLQWAQRKRTILHPTAEDLETGMKDFKIAWKYSLATSRIDGLTYTYDFNTGTIVKFDPVTRKGQFVTQFTEGSNSHGILAFHPVEQHILYIGLIQKYAIYMYNTLTGEFSPYAGTLGVSGWRDGLKNDCYMGKLGQFVFDDNLNLIFADQGNHCIRQITPEGIVSTIIGKPTRSGYVDGNPDDAEFNEPIGMCIDSDYNIYIADSKNNCIRKLVVE
jgi:sugar lactone lactonase YvrE